LSEVAGIEPQAERFDVRQSARGRADILCYCLRDRYFGRVQVDVERD
jgi:hypothetical protein